MRCLSTAIACILLSLPWSASASTTMALFRGEMELVTISGSGCTEKDKSGSRLPLELTLKQEGPASGSQISGYFKGPDIQVGRVSGVALGQLQVFYPDAPGSSQGNTLSLVAGTGGLEGELHENPKQDSGDCYFEKAVVHLRQEADGSEAEAVFLRQADLFSAETHYLSGQALLQADKPKEAIPELTKSLELRRKLNPGDPEISYSAVSLATARTMDGQETKALSLLQGLLGNRSDAGDAVVQQRIAVSAGLCSEEQYLQNEAGQKAAERLMDLVAREFGGLNGVSLPLAACYNEMGKLHKEQDDPETAIGLFQQALKLNPDNPESMAGIAMSYVDMDLPTQGRNYLSEHAKEFIHGAGKESFDDFMSYLYAAEAQQAEGDGEVSRAEELFGAAVKAKPQDRVAVIQLSRLLAKEGKNARARALLDEGRKGCGDQPCRQDYADELARQELIVRMVKRLETRSGKP